MDGVVRPEDVLPDGQDRTDLGGTSVRKGSVAAFVANARALAALAPGDPRRGPLVAALRDLEPALRALGLFDVFALRPPVRDALAAPAAP